MESHSVSGCPDSFPLRHFLLQQSRIMLESMEYLLNVFSLILRSWLLSQYRIRRWMEFMSLAYLLMVLSGTDRCKCDINSVWLPVNNQFLTRF
jgi:hypothetical protein